MKNESQNKSHPIFNKEIHIVEQSDKDFTEETYSCSKQFDSIFTDNDFIQKCSKNLYSNIFNRFYITLCSHTALKLNEESKDFLSFSLKFLHCRQMTRKVINSPSFEIDTIKLYEIRTGRKGEQKYQDTQNLQDYVLSLDLSKPKDLSVLQYSRHRLPSIHSLKMHNLRPHASIEYFLINITPNCLQQFYFWGEKLINVDEYLEGIQQTVESTNDVVYFCDCNLRALN